MQILEKMIHIERFAACNCRSKTHISETYIRHHRGVSNYVRSLVEHSAVVSMNGYHSLVNKSDFSNISMAINFKTRTALYFSRFSRDEHCDFQEDQSHLDMTYRHRMTPEV